MFNRLFSIITAAILTLSMAGSAFADWNVPDNELFRVVFSTGAGATTTIVNDLGSISSIIASGSNSTIAGTVFNYSTLGAAANAGNTYAVYFAKNNKITGTTYDAYVASTAAPVSGNRRFVNLNTGVINFTSLYGTSSSKTVADPPNTTGTLSDYQAKFGNAGTLAGFIGTGQVESPLASLAILNLYEFSASSASTFPVTTGVAVTNSGGIPVTIMTNTDGSTTINPPSATFTVSYNGNGSTGGSAPIDGSSPYTSGSIVTVLGNTGNLLKTGFTFVGWNTAADGSGTDYATAATFTIVGNTTLYAKWISNAPIAVNYNANGNTGGSVPIDGSSPYTPGSTVTVLGNTGNLSKTGFTFAGWNTAADGSGTDYAAAATFTIVGNTTLYAKWISSAPIAVNYNANGNTGGSAPIDGSSPYTPGSTVTVLGNTGNLSKTGFTFAGWNTAADGSGTSYAAAATFTIFGNKTLYAKWTTNSYTISFVAGVQGTISGPPNQTVNFGAAATAVTAVPSAGYQFGNWTGTGGFATTTSNPLIVTNVSAAQTITANFSVIPPISFTVSTAAGTNGSISPAQTVVAGNTAVFTVTPVTGFQISTVTGCNGTLNGDKYTTAGILRDCTVNATFTAIPKLKGDLNGDGKVDLADALLAMQFAIGLKKPTAADIAAGDIAPFVNGKSAPDGRIDIADAVAMLQKSVGLMSW